MHYALHWLRAAVEARQTAEPHAVTYVDFLTVTLTALCALLAILAFIVALAAIWGYLGIRREITKAVTKRATQAIEAKLAEYPDSEEIIDLVQEIRDFHEKQKVLSNQLVADSKAKSVARASKRVQDKGKASAAFAKDYPGKGK
jgi:hypothetical protein